VSELGLGGAVGLRTSRYLGAGRDNELKTWLASARTLFLLLAAGVAMIFLVLAPVLPDWLRFVSLPAAGSLPVLFALGAGGLFLMVVASYFNNLSYACGNVAWPIMPQFFLVQMTFLAQWLLAVRHAPLYLIYLPSVVVALLNISLIASFVRVSHRGLANLFPLRFHAATAFSLFSLTGWVFLCTVGSAIYTTTDRLLINAGFGPARVTTYQLNYKLCELAVPTMAIASFVLMPKLGQWIASTNESDRHRAVVVFLKLNQIQSFLGCAVAMGYLLVNDLFIQLWIGSEQQAPLLWQFAFAANLAVTVSGDSVVQIAGRCGSRGIHTAGMVIGIAAILNLALSVASMASGWIAGIALATVVAQILQIYLLGKFSLGYLSIPRGPFFIKSMILPLLSVTVLYVFRIYFHAMILVPWMIYLVILLIIGRILGLNFALLKEEFQMFRRSFS